MKLENWAMNYAANPAPFKAPEQAHYQLSGEVYGHPRFDDGTFVVTSRVVDVNKETEIVETYSGSEYELGVVHPEYELRYPDARARFFE